MLFTVDKLNFGCIELYIKFGKDHHFAFRGLGFSLLGQHDVGHAIVAAGCGELRLPSPQLRGLLLKLFPQESSWWPLP
ncbi:hypothetical protein AM499_10100 [Bacillus sp. FJAT-22090]|nr:hypothetical protein AM499_10100 [Bacillus sp. FJAT-22090]